MAETDQCRRQLPILQRQPVAPGFGVPDEVDLILQHDLHHRIGKSLVVTR
jgi:hypothetical protein